MLLGLVPILCLVNLPVDLIIFRVPIFSLLIIAAIPCFILRYLPYISLELKLCLRRIRSLGTFLLVILLYLVYSFLNPVSLPAFIVIYWLPILVVSILSIFAFTNIDSHVFHQALLASLILFLLLSLAEKLSGVNIHYLYCLGSQLCNLEDMHFANPLNYSSGLQLSTEKLYSSLRIAGPGGSPNFSATVLVALSPWILYWQRYLVLNLPAFIRNSVFPVLYLALLVVLLALSNRTAIAVFIVTSIIFALSTTRKVKVRSLISLSLFLVATLAYIIHGNLYSSALNRFSEISALLDEQRLSAYQAISSIPISDLLMGRGGTPESIYQFLNYSDTGVLTILFLQGGLAMTALVMLFIFHLLHDYTQSFSILSANKSISAHKYRCMLVVSLNSSLNLLLCFAPNDYLALYLIPIFSLSTLVSLYRGDIESTL